MARQQTHEEPFLCSDFYVDFFERIERKVDAISERLGLDPDESDEPAPEREQDA